MRGGDYAGPMATIEQNEKRRGRPTRDQAAERDRLLFDRALDLFLEHGFEQTTVDRLIAATGLAKRTFYARYGDKLSLFKLALQGAIDDWIIPVERLAAEESDDLESTLLRVSSILLFNLMSPAGLRLFRITNAVTYRLPEIGAYTYLRGTKPAIDYLADLFRRRLGADMTPSPETAAAAFNNLVVGGPARLAAWGMEMSRTDLEKHIADSVHLLLHGILKH